MKAVAPFLFALSSSFVIERQDDAPPGAPPGHWQPKTTNPHFFQILVEDNCRQNYAPIAAGNQVAPANTANTANTNGAANGGTTGANAGGTRRKRQTTNGANNGGTAGTGGAGGAGGAGNGGAPQCRSFRGYGVRLTEGKAIATPYNKWKDPPLPTLFVDDDTTMYTVSKQPLQFYIDSVTGALKYTQVGWLPPDAISVGFYHTGSNPMGTLYPSPAYVTWPSTYGYTERGKWLFCEFGFTGQYQIFINDRNFSPQGAVDTSTCYPASLAAIDANPWQKPKPKPSHHDSGDDWSDDQSDDY